MKTVFLIVGLLAAGPVMAQQASCEQIQTLNAYRAAIAQQEHIIADTQRQIQAMGLAVPVPATPITTAPPANSTQDKQPDGGC